MTSGRHRRPPRRRLASPLPLAAAVVGLLALLGVGAALLPVTFTRSGDSTFQGGTAAGAGGPNLVDSGSASATPTVGATPTASASTGPTTTATPGASPTRKVTPTPRRTTKKPAAAPSKTTAKPVTADSREAEVVEIVNRERAANGCGPVTVNGKLANAARLHSKDQAEHNNMSHTGSDGSTPWDRAERAGYSNAIGENVAAGYKTPEAVMEGWMNSDGHRANILNCDAKAIGVGVVAASDGTLYWTQMFGSVA